MSKTISQRLFEANEPYAAGLFEFPEREPLFRHANALYRDWENAKIMPYEGGALYPCGKCVGKGNPDIAVRPDYSYTYEIRNRDLLRQKLDDECFEAVIKEHRLVSGFPTPHTVGGAGYTHCFLNYERILKDGINTYRKRVEDLPDGDFREGLLRLLDGMDIYKNRIIEHLKSCENVYPGLIEALEHVNEVPTTLYEALVLWNFVYYVDGCDDIGRLDKHLYRFWNGEDIVDILHELYTHVDANDGWSGALGPEYNELTCQCIRACHYIRRPSLQLRVLPDMPDEVWEEVYASLATSCGQPALYNENLYQKVLEREFPEIPKEDRLRCVFGGCTETMLEGVSNVGSDDLGINTALIYDQFTRANLDKYDTFDSYFDALCEQMKKEIVESLDILTQFRITRAKHRPQPVHTLFVDDCIDKQLEFNAGGARYYWSVSNVAGLINVIDSLSVVKELIFEKKEYDAASFMEALDSRDPVFLRKARKCPCFGVDDDRVDLIGRELANRIYDSFNERKCWPSGKYMTVSNQFTTYEGAGKPVHATPDGRGDGEPLCDCLGAVHSKDIKGPTALLSSTSKLPLDRVTGTPVMNIRMKKEHLSTLLKPLVMAYFEKNGMQLQVSCMSREEMLDAIEHPEKHENLIVRIGGFSEYFNRLTPVLQQTVLQRTEY